MFGTIIDKYRLTELFNYVVGTYMYNIQIIQLFTVFRYELINLNFKFIMLLKIQLKIHHTPICLLFS